MKGLSLALRRQAMPAGQPAVSRSRRGRAGHHARWARRRRSCRRGRARDPAGV